MQTLQGGKRTPNCYRFTAKEKEKTCQMYSNSVKRTPNGCRFTAGKTFLYSRRLFVTTHQRQQLVKTLCYNMPSNNWWPIIMHVVFFSHIFNSSTETNKPMELVFKMKFVHNFPSQSSCDLQC